ncbi:hypothetical protein Q9K02_03950 [Qipengyuania sp. G39]|uniref:Lipoprotein n=1 Tax=Qipengyuania profundimaris TaxID=3067652 RepID=A0ABT9HMB0_9SPHN|nr:hypothetical protein [Qipengyuania sp. G39]MDP4574289.1 hypothetical protein [Qipengyuania sp. G39]
MTRLALASITVFALFACSPGQTTPDDPAPQQTAIPVEPDGGIGDGAPPLPELIGTIPPRFRGVWDFVEGSCAPASDLRIEIGEDSITFYESAGQLTGIEDSGTGSVIVTLAMEGEGETWEERRELVLEDGGARLLVLDPADPSAGRDLPRKRCDN